MTAAIIMALLAPVLARYDVPFTLVQTIIQVESDYNPQALGDNGTSFGLFQLHLGGQADKAIQDGHEPQDLYDPLLNAQYAMPSIAAAWDALKGSFNPESLAWWLLFATQSGHPGGSNNDPATIHEATALQQAYKALTGGDVSTLKNFPIVSQLTDTTASGPSENKQFDCVAASIGASILYYQGKQQWDKSINPDRIKDAVYGNTYVGGTSASDYIPFVESLGYKLSPINDTPAQLIKQAHLKIRAGIPVIFTEPDPYVDASLGWSHVCVFYAEAPGSLTAMDPYVAKSIKKADADWQKLLMFNQLWIVEQENAMHLYSPDSPSFASWYTSNKKGDVWICKSNQKTVAFGILGLYKQLSVDGKSLPLPGLPVTGELTLTVKGVKIVVQIFERMVLVYDPTHALDSQPGLEDAYIAHLDNPELLKLIPGLALPAGGVNPAIVASAKTANLAIADLFEKLGISG